jgi:hypothetical protein
MTSKLVGYGLFIGVCLVAVIIMLGMVMVHGAQAADTEELRKRDKQWFLIVPVYNCGECKDRQMRLSMPSLDDCRRVRDLNSGTLCMTQDDEKAHR